MINLNVNKLVNQKILKYFYIHISLIIFNYQFILAKDLTIILQIYLKIKVKLFNLFKVKH